IEIEQYILLLLSDGNLPTGSFAPSSGLESYVKHGLRALGYLPWQYRENYGLRVLQSRILLTQCPSIRDGCTCRGIRNASRVEGSWGSDVQRMSR
ncbi:hypothetical protein JB92DRAFT_3264389, partial [Gautieria morchelliformis]